MVFEIIFFQSVWSTALSIEKQIARLQELCSVYVTQASFHTNVKFNRKLENQEHQKQKN